VFESEVFGISVLACHFFILPVSMLLAKFLLVQFIYFGLWIQGSFNGWRYDIALWAFIWSWWNAACYQNGQFSIEGIFGL
jgi:hypothetical protein